MRTFVCSLVLAGILALGCSVSAAEDPLMTTINKLYGVPYKTAGSTTNGFDCSGFTSFVFNALGAEIPRTSASQYLVGQAVAKQDLQPGDLVFFNTNGRGVSHVGIYIGNNTFAHSASGQGVVKTSLSDPYYWASRYVGAKRIPIPAVEAAKQAAAAEAQKEAEETAKQEALAQAQQDAAEQGKQPDAAQQTTEAEAAALEKQPEQAAAQS